MPGLPESGASGRIRFCQQRLSRNGGSPEQTEYSAEVFDFARVKGREVGAAFDGGTTTSDVGRCWLARPTR
jgi:hypothetical protein